VCVKISQIFKTLLSILICSGRLRLQYYTFLYVSYLNYLSAICKIFLASDYESTRPGFSRRMQYTHVLPTSPIPPHYHGSALLFAVRGLSCTGTGTRRFRNICFLLTFYLRACSKILLSSIRIYSVTC
jgi:hypothetical protein